MKNTHILMIGKYFLFISATLFFFAVAASAMENDIGMTAQVIIEESVAALWLGNSFSPQLEKEQQSLRNILENRSITGAELERIVARTMLSILNSQKTSRYNLREMYKGVEELLAPYMKRGELRKIVWHQLSSQFGEGRQFNVKVGTLAPVGTPWLVLPERLVAEIQELSGNKVIFKIYSGGVMGEDVDVLRKMDMGQLDGCGCTAMGILKAAPEAYVFLLPGLFRNYEEIDFVLNKFRKMIDRTFEEKGYMLAALVDTGNFYLFSRFKTDNLAGIKKNKTITTFGVIETELFDELGIHAIPISIPEIIPSLNTGIADTVVAPASWMLGMQAYQYVNCFIKEPLFYSPAAVIVSAKIKDKLQRDINLSETVAHNITELTIFEFISLEKDWKAQTRHYEKKCLEAFIYKVGMRPLVLPPEDRAVIEQAGKKVWEKLAGDVCPRELLNDILRALEEYRRN